MKKRSVGDTLHDHIAYDKKKVPADRQKIRLARNIAISFTNYLKDIVLAVAIFIRIFNRVSKVCTSNQREEA